MGIAGLNNQSTCSFLNREANSRKKLKKQIVSARRYRGYSNKNLDKSDCSINTFYLCTDFPMIYFSSQFSKTKSLANS